MATFFSDHFGVSADRLDAYGAFVAVNVLERQWRFCLWYHYKLPVHLIYNAMKAKTLFTMNYLWAAKYLRKRLDQHIRYYWSKVIGRTYWENRYGVKLGFATPYHHSIAQLHALEAHEPEVMRRWAEAARSARLIYDLGGYNGVFGLVAAKVNPLSRVVIFEPDAVNYAHVKANIALNALSNVDVRQVAVTNYNGAIQFKMNGTSGARIGDGTTVQCVRLDSLPQADLLKIDVEGAEGDVIAGADLTNRPVILLEQHQWLSDADSMWERLSALGYAPNPFNQEKDGVHHFLEIG